MLLLLLNYPICYSQEKECIVTRDPYFGVHHDLRRSRGPASDYTCPCGEPAQDWAYQFTGEEGPGSRSYSTDLNDYTAMCRSCHREFDIANDPGLALKVREGGKRGGAAMARRVKEDPEFAEVVRGRNRENGRKGGKRGGAAMARRVKEDPEFAEVVRERNRENGRRTAAMRRRCLECGKESSPSGMGNHRRFTGHDSWISC